MTRSPKRKPNGKIEGRLAKSLESIDANLASAQKSLAVIMASEDKAMIQQAMVELGIAGMDVQAFIRAKTPEKRIGLVLRVLVSRSQN